MNKPVNTGGLMPCFDGVKLLSVDLVTRRQVAHPSQLFDQSVENVWDWYNDVKRGAHPEFKLEFLEGFVARLMKERKHE